MSHAVIGALPVDRGQKLQSVTPHLFIQKFKSHLQLFVRLLYGIATLCIVTGCATLDSPHGGSEDQVLHSHAFTFKDEGKALYYSFELGTPPADDVTIFFLSGSGCASLKGRFPGYFEPIRNRISARVLALQKRGIEEESGGAICSRIFRSTDYFDQTVSDQKEFIDRQLAMKPVLPRVVVLMGASEGAVVAAKIASMDSRITHIALIGGGGSTVQENLQLLSKRTWYLGSPKEIFSAIAIDPNSTEKTAWGHSYKYWSSLSNVNIGELLLSLNVPIVMAMGEHDESVPVETAITLKRKFDDNGKFNFNLYVFPGADHRLYDRAHSLSYAKDFLEALIYHIELTTESGVWRIATDPTLTK